MVIELFYHVTNDTFIIEISLLSSPIATQSHINSEPIFIKVFNVALNQIETDRWIKQYGDVLFKVIVAQSKYIKLLERRIGESFKFFRKFEPIAQGLFCNKLW